MTPWPHRCGPPLSALQRIFLAGADAAGSRRFFLWKSVRSVAEGSVALLDRGVHLLAARCRAATAITDTSRLSHLCQGHGVQECTKPWACTRGRMAARPPAKVGISGAAGSGQGARLRGPSRVRGGIVPPDASGRVGARWPSSKPRRASKIAPDPDGSGGQHSKRRSRRRNGRAGATRRRLIPRVIHHRRVVTRWRMRWRGRDPPDAVGPLSQRMQGG